MALATLTGHTALLTPAKIKNLTGKHVRTLTRRGLVPHVRGGHGHANQYKLADVLLYASMPPGKNVTPPIDRGADPVALPAHPATGEGAP